MNLNINDDKCDILVCFPKSGHISQQITSVWLTIMIMSNLMVALPFIYKSMATFCDQNIS